MCGRRVDDRRTQKILLFYRNQISFDDFVAWNVAFGPCVNSRTFNGGRFLVNFSATATYFMATSVALSYFMLENYMGELFLKFTAKELTCDKRAKW